ncbi:hypothetical protein EVAR_25897_1 [Eumeta japonica]|uniref:Uncharacterized protein n=1 Tax=Eumeta variegata TaxID=151549 RepID=A0A4C1W3S1_EUMVA|nr:hypothetical protein EVAR_25897_1 [Eumeta japonica]
MYTHNPRGVTVHCRPSGKKRLSDGGKSGLMEKNVGLNPVRAITDNEKQRKRKEHVTHSALIPDYTRSIFLRRCLNAETQSRHESPDCGAKRGITHVQ